MLILRLAGLLLIVLALMLLGADVVSTLEKNGETVIRSFDSILLLLGVDAAPWLQQKLPAPLAPILIAAFSWPGWAILGIPGILLGMLAAGKRDSRRPLPPPSSPINR